MGVSCHVALPSPSRRVAKHLATELPAPFSSLKWSRLTNLPYHDWNLCDHEGALHIRPWDYTEEWITGEPLHLTAVLASLAQIKGRILTPEELRRLARTHSCEICLGLGASWPL